MRNRVSRYRRDRSGRAGLCTSVLAVCMGGLPAAAPLAQGRPAWFDPTTVDDAPVIAEVRTRHSGTYNGTQLTYEALAGELLLPGSNGAPAATMFSTAYVRTGAAASPDRPVLFLFNGGPGASSSPLHLGIGPVRRPEGDTRGELVPNAPSPIDAMDLVFIDPVGTGYTRLLKEGAGEQFWGIEQDANAVLFLIRDWLERQGRTQSPVFIMGESYGGARAAVVANLATRQPVADTADAVAVKLRGLILLSPALDFSAGTEVVGNNLPYVALLPAMTATAAYHGVVDPGRASFMEVFEDSARYAQTDYALALYKGNSISSAEKQAVADRLARLTGLDQEFIRRANLRIDFSTFRDRLLAAKGMRVGRLDARVKGPTADFKDKRPPGDDPSMSGGGGGPSTGEVLDEYFANELGIRTPRPYRTLNLDLNSKWDYGQKGPIKTYFSVAPELQAAMQGNDRLRVLIAGGIFDFATPIMAARYTASQIDADPGRFEFRGYEGGHSTFDHELSRIALCDDMRAFVRAPPGATSSVDAEH